SDPKANLRCDYCGRWRHTRADCRKLAAHTRNKGSGEGRGQQYKPRANTATTLNEGGLLSKEQLEQILSLLKPQLAISGNPSDSSARSGNLSLTQSDSQHNDWILDSGASDHMTNTSFQFVSYTPDSGSNKIKVADGNFATIAGKGNIPLSTYITLKSVLHVQKLSHSLLSIHKLTHVTNCLVHFYPFHCIIQDRSSGRVIGRGSLREGLYFLDVEDPSVEKGQGLVCASSSSAYGELMLLHSRLGHPSFHYLKHLFPSKFQGIKLSDFKCDACHFAKDHRVTFPARGYSPSKPFYLIHSDVWGPSKISTISGKKWFITFIDDHTRMCWLYFFTKKTEVEGIFRQFHKMIQTQFGVGISILRTDNGTEYFNTSLTDFLRFEGIVHQSSCPYTPQQNGIAERKK
ncbi:Retrovirus-related Pol polyprotein from transposon RE2, partial [Linum perenne]